MNFVGKGYGLASAWLSHRRRQQMNMQALDPTWPDSRTFWCDKRVIVTGPSTMLRTSGSGFLGSFIVDKLRDRGAAEVIVPRRTAYDLRDIDAIRRLLLDVIGHPPHPERRDPVYVIHLAAHVGGIGANRAKPVEFFYDNPSTCSGQA
jgi:GDP-L-fucose synthase